AVATAAAPECAGPLPWPPAAVAPHLPSPFRACARAAYPFETTRNVGRRAARLHPPLGGRAQVHSNGGGSVGWMKLQVPLSPEVLLAQAAGRLSRLARTG